MTLLRLYVSCITTIDTIILTNYTNDAYTYDTGDVKYVFLTKSGPGPVRQVGV
jgi:hypothetical protein